VRRDFPRLLETFRPDVVLIMIGSNDFWTVPAELPAAGPKERPVDWKQWSRAYRLLFMMRRAWQRRQLDVVMPPPATKQHGEGKARYGDEEFALTWTVKQGGVLDWVARLKENLAAVAREANEFGALPVFLTYPSELQVYGPTSVIIREVARTTGTRLADVGAAFRTNCPTPACPTLLFRDGHANAAGYAVVANILEQQLGDMLDGARPTSQGSR
jgi:lysophospholipase L1-like esterase